MPDSERQLFNELAAGVWVIGPDNRTEHVNLRMAHMLDAIPAEMDGVPFLEFIVEEGRAEALEYLVRCRQGAHEQADVPLRSKRGARRWGLFVAHPLAGSPTGRASVACLVVDISERKLVERELHQSESRYRVLAETAQDHIFVIDHQDRVEYVNRAAAWQFRSTPEQLIGRHRADLFPPDIAERQGRGLNHVLTTGQPLYVEGRTMYRDHEVWLGTWLAPVPDSKWRGEGGARALARHDRAQARGGCGARQRAAPAHGAVECTRGALGHRSRRRGDVLRREGARSARHHADRRRGTRARGTPNRALHSRRTCNARWRARARAAPLK